MLESTDDLRRQHVTVDWVISGPSKAFWPIFAGMGIPISKIRRSRDHHNSNMGIPLLVKPLILRWPPSYKPSHEPMTTTVLDVTRRRQTDTMGGTFHLLVTSLTIKLDIGTKLNYKPNWNIRPSHSRKYIRRTGLYNFRLLVQFVIFNVSQYNIRWMLLT